MPVSSTTIEGDALQHWRSLMRRNISLVVQRNPRRWSERKMCVVLQHILARGLAARPRCIPQAVALSWDRPHPEPAERIAVPSLAGDFALPAPIDLAGVPAPKTPAHSMEATSWRRLHRDQGRELSCCPFPGPIPSTNEPSRPWNPDLSIGIQT